jgi:hypothetical protein
MTVTSDPASRYPKRLEISWRVGRQTAVLRILRSDRHDYPEDISLVRHFRPEAPPKPLAPTVEIDLAAPLPTTRELLEADVEAIGVIHRARLCLGGEVEAERTAGSVVIRGSVADPYRREQLTGLFDALPAARFLMLHVDAADALPALSLGQSPAGSGAPTRGWGPAEPWLRKRLHVGERVTEREMYDLMNRVVTAAEDLSSEAAALRLLRERYSKADVEQMAQETKSLLQSMEEDHVLAILGQITDLKNTLAFGNFDKAGEAPPGAESIGAEQAGNLQQQEKHVNALALRLFSSSDGISGNEIADPDERLSELLVSLDRLRLETIRFRQMEVAGDRH